VADQLTLRLQLQALELPQAPVPEIEPGLIAAHLAFDDGEVGGRRLLRHRLKLRQLAAHPLEQTDLETNQVGVNSDPVPGVSPMGRGQVLARQSRRGLLSHAGHM